MSLKKEFLKKSNKYSISMNIPEWYYYLVLEISQSPHEYLVLFNYGTQIKNVLKLKQNFMIYVLTKNNTYYDFKKFKDVYESNTKIAELWQKDPEMKDIENWSAAWSAASAAESASWSVARSAAWSAASAAESVAWSAASAAESAAESAAKKDQCLKIIELIKEQNNDL